MEGYFYMKLQLLEDIKDVRNGGKTIYAEEKMDVPKMQEKQCHVNINTLVSKEMGTRDTEIVCCLFG